VSCTSNIVVDDLRNTKRGDVERTLLNINDDYDKLYGSEQTGLDVSKLLATPPPPPIGNGELISFSVTEEVPLKDILIELGRLAEVDIEIDPKINTGIILRVTEKPINIVIDKICDLANLKYEYNDGILRIERDLPYNINYDVDILLESELWESVQASMQYIMDIFPVKKHASLTDSDMSIATDVDVVSGDEQRISVNKPAGIISVYANSKAQKAIEKFIKQAKDNYSSQVLIEAKVVEVKLKDSYQAGINWDLAGIGGGMLDEITTTNSSGSSAGITRLAISRGLGSKNLNIVIDAMQEFGNTKTISSPRISTLNNQKANLDFINTLVYFSIEESEDTTTSSSSDSGFVSQKTYTSTKQTEDIGVKLEITPAIDLKRGEITLTVKPELSTLDGYVQDPINEKNMVPVVQKRTLETSLKIKSGDVMVIGGLMSESIDNTDTGIPFLMHIPILGNLFKSKKKNKELIETVIFIKATIVNRNDALSGRDRKIFNDFTKN
jgi:general secretion pathway protein D